MTTNLSDAEVRARRRLLLEREWIERRMAGDALFARLRSTHRDHAFQSRLFVAWTIVNGEPAINAMLRCDRIEAGRSGVSVKFEVVRPGQSGKSLFWAMHQPQRVQDLDLYLWVPAFADMQYAPFDFAEPDGPWRLSAPVVSKSRSNPLYPATEGHTYFASQTSFCEIWPKHAF